VASRLIESVLQQPQAAIMGIVNVTPDSFSDGGQFLNSDSAFRHALQLVEQGADILDIGGESTRPGAEIVSLQQELDRVIPVIEKLAQETDTPISIDTYKPQVMDEAVRAGASLVNDVNALRAECALEMVAKLKVPVCLMHMQGQPKTMQQSPKYRSVVDEVIEFLADRIDQCLSVGIDAKHIIVDPGIGFGKSLEHNLSLLKGIEKIESNLDCPILIGVSRKSMIDQLLDRSLEKRLSASIGLAVQAVLNGAKIVRVHDVQETYDAIRSIEAVMNAPQ